MSSSEIPEPVLSARLWRELRKGQSTVRWLAAVAVIGMLAAAVVGLVADDPGGWVVLVCLLTLATMVVNGLRRRTLRKRGPL